MAKRKRSGLKPTPIKRHQPQPLDEDGRLRNCVPKAYINPADDKPCQSCGKLDGYPEFLLCDGCGSGGHLTCYKLKSIPEGFWVCPTCKINPTIDSAVRQVLHAAGKCGLLFEQIGHQVRSRAGGSERTIKHALERVMSPVNAFVEFDDEIVHIGDRYILRPLSAKPDLLCANPDPSPSRLVIPDSQSENSDCGFAPPSGLAYTTERTPADRSCTPSSAVLQHSDSSGQHIQQDADSRQLHDSTHHTAAASLPEAMHTSHPALPNTPVPDEEQALPASLQRDITAATAENSGPSTGRQLQPQAQLHSSLMALYDDYISRQSCCALAAACQREGGTQELQLACMAAFLAWAHMHNHRQPSCSDTAENQAEGFDTSAQSGNPGNDMQHKASHQSSPDPAGPQAASALEPMATDENQLPALSAQPQDPSPDHSMASTTPDAAQDIRIDQDMASTVAEDAQDARCGQDIARVVPGMATHQRSGNDPADTAVQQLATSTQAPDTAAAASGVTEAGPHHQDHPPHQDAVLLRRALTAAGTSSSGMQQKLQILEHVLNIVPEMLRHAKPLFAWVQSLQREAAAALVEEVLRVMQVLADTEGLAPMVGIFLHKYWQTLLKEPS